MIMEILMMIVAFWAIMFLLFAIIILGFYGFIAFAYSLMFPFRLIFEYEEVREELKCLKPIGLWLKDKFSIIGDLVMRPHRPPKFDDRNIDELVNSIEGLTLKGK